jgi:hypothetical protein
MTRRGVRRGEDSFLGGAHRDLVPNLFEATKSLVTCH